MVTAPIDALARIVGGDGILTEPADYAVDGMTPRAVVYPRSVSEVQEVVRLANARELAIIPWGGGTRMAFGMPPRALDLVVDLTRLEGEIAHDPEDLVARVPAGRRWAEMQSELAAHGQTVPVDPPRQDQATVGGVAASNSNGPRRARHGALRDRIIGLAAVDATGRFLRAGGKVVKNVTGYDFGKLFVGSFGTLGIIVECIFKLEPAYASRTALFVRASGFDEAWDVMRTVRAAGLAPSYAVVLSPLAAREILGTAGNGAEPPAYAVLLGFNGVEADVVWQTDQAAQLEGRAVPVPTEALDAVYAAVCDFTAGPGDLVLRGSVLPTAVPPLCEALESAASPVTYLVHVEDGTVVARLAEGAPGDEAAADWVGELRRLAYASGGHLFVERAMLGVKESLDVWGNPGDSASLMAALKRRVDPAGVMSPGRFAAGL